MWWIVEDEVDNNLGGGRGGGRCSVVSLYLRAGQWNGSCALSL